MELPKSIGKSHELMSSIKSILNDSLSQWSRLTEIRKKKNVKQIWLIKWKWVAPFFFARNFHDAAPRDVSRRVDVTNSLLF